MADDVENVTMDIEACNEAYCGCDVASNWDASWCSVQDVMECGREMLTLCGKHERS